MGRSPCCEKEHTNKGAWTKEEDQRLINHIRLHGEGGWRSLPKAAGLLRCGKSCRLRWCNYLRPDVKRGNFTPEEDDLIIKVHSLVGNKWSLIAGRLPGRTDNEIKNYWNTHIKRKLVSRGVDPQTHRPIPASAARPSASPSASAALRSVSPTPLPAAEIGLAIRFPESNVASAAEDGNCRSSITEEGNQEKVMRFVDLDLSIGLIPFHSEPAHETASTSSSAAESLPREGYPAKPACACGERGACVCCHLGLQLEGGVVGSCSNCWGPRAELWWRYDS